MSCFWWQRYIFSKQKVYVYFDHLPLSLKKGPTVFTLTMDTKKYITIKGKLSISLIYNKKLKITSWSPLENSCLCKTVRYKSILTIRDSIFEHNYDGKAVSIHFETERIHAKSKAPCLVKNNKLQDSQRAERNSFNFGP